MAPRTTRTTNGTRYTRVAAAITATATAAVLTLLAGGTAQASTAAGSQHGATPVANAGQQVTGGADSALTSGLGAPWAREVISLGARDDGPYHIQHVLELQIRLRWVGLYHRIPTGEFGGDTRTAVREFQARKHLTVTGVANALTWARLLQSTLRNVGATPGVCKTTGWHACYDRSVHAVNLWHDGHMDNTWLVRGGAVDTQTRLGTHQVYYRDIDHVSSEFGTAMPYSQFFDGGEALHGSPLMTNPFVGHSHGCINMYIEDARQLWNLTHAVPLWVTVYGSWS